MNREKISHWINSSEKLKEMSCTSCGKDTSQGVFTIAYPI